MIGYNFTLYSLDELMNVYVVVFGGALVASAIIILIMRVLKGGDRY